MRNFFLILAFCAMGFMVQAGTFMTGVNQLAGLLLAVEAENGSDPEGLSKALQYADNGMVKGDQSNWLDDNKVPLFGFVWAPEGYTPYFSSGDSKYRLLTAINWTDKHYVQKPDKAINLNQDAMTGDASAKEKNDLSALETIDFSGNSLRDISLDGLGALTTVNLSGNSSLESLSITHCTSLSSVNISNCASLSMLDITNNGLALSKIYTLSQALPASAELKYAPQGVVSLSFPIDAVDLSAELVLGSTDSEITWLGAQPKSNNGGVFSFDTSLCGQKLTAKLTNSSLPAFGNEGIIYEITLASYKVTSKVNNETFGSISPAELETVYEEGSEITCTLTPEDGCEILKLTVNGVDKTAEIVDGVYTLTDLSENLTIIASFRPAGQNYYLTMPPLPYPEMPGIANIPYTKALFDPATRTVSNFPIWVEDAAKFMTVRPGNNVGEIAAEVHPEVGGVGKWHVIGYDICLLNGPNTLKPGFYDFTYEWNDLDSAYYIRDTYLSLLPFTVKVDVSATDWEDDIYVHVKGDTEQSYKMTPLKNAGWYACTFEDESTAIDIYFTNGEGGEEDPDENRSEDLLLVYMNRCVAIDANLTVADAECPEIIPDSVATVDELIEGLTANTDPTAIFVLTDDLDMDAWISEQPDEIKEKGWKSLGTAEQPVTGTIDGDGHFLYNIWSYRPDESSSGGFIARANNLTIKNLGIQTKEGKALVGRDNFGGFVCDFNRVQILQCCFNGVLKGEKQGGAFLGYTEAEGSSIRQSYAYGGVYGTDNIGGLWGKTTKKQSLVEESYAIVTVNGAGGQGSAAGIVGSADLMNATENDVVLTVKNSVVLNDSIAGAWAVASVCAYNRNAKNVEVVNSVELDKIVKQGAGKPSVVNATVQCTREQAVEADLYTGRNWDFENVWQMDNGDYPLPVLKNLNTDYQPNEMPHHLRYVTGLFTPAQPDVRVYPNPTDGRLWIKAEKTLAVSVYDTAGRLIETGFSNSEIDLSAYRPGFYLLKLENRYIKIIKK